MSFGTHARRTRDRDLPYRTRYGALRSAVSHYCPIGFNATWSFLSMAGNLKRDEQALIRALDLLETSRNTWLAELDAFAARRRVEKQHHRRTPSASDRIRFNSYRWPGPDGHAAVLRTVEQLWEAHRGEPFPETPTEIRGDLVYLDETIAGCVSSYLNSGGEAGPSHRDLLPACIAGLNKQIRQLGYPRSYSVAFRYFLRLHKLADLVLSEAPDRLPQLIVVDVEP